MVLGGIIKSTFNLKLGISIKGAFISKALWLLAVSFWVFSTSSHSQTLGLEGQVIIGYQGWFGCPNDFDGNKSWIHWFNGPALKENLTVEMFPALDEYKAEDLCDTGIVRPDGKETLKLFSSQNPNIVNKHFEWMKQYGIQTIAAQRFISQTLNPRAKKRSDNVLNNIQNAAITHGRSFYVAYDISGGNPKTVIDDVRNDWIYLSNQLQVRKSAAYLRVNGKPVIQLWGFGFTGHPGESEEVRVFIEDLKNGRNGLPASIVIGGVPAHWRTLDGDSKGELGWSKTYRTYNFISPWSVGRFSNPESEARFMRDIVAPDLVETRRLGIGYIPVIFPGFSWKNLMLVRNQKTQAIHNQIPRNCGNFIWQQIQGLLRLKVSSIYIAMFDEVDEGTAIFKTIQNNKNVPAGIQVVTMSEDSCEVTNDWYLRIAGKLAEYLRPGYRDNIDSQPYSMPTR